MFTNLKRAYYMWRLRLVECEILDTQADIFAARVCNDYETSGQQARWLEDLLNDKRRYEFRLAQLPVPVL